MKLQAKRVYIIAEAGVNHNGSLDIAKELIDVAADAGADAVKFQTFTAENVASKTAPKAAYQHKAVMSESQLKMLRRLELDKEAHRELFDHCRVRGIQFLSTPFDMESIDLLSKELDLPVLKLPSGDITNAPLLLRASRTGKPIILSTGMSTLEEIKIALGVLAFGYVCSGTPPSMQAFDEALSSEEGRRALEERVTLLHCTTEYPAALDDVNLRAMNALKVAFRLPVGLSDHTMGIEVSIAAVALGASVIEKHFTLDRTMIGPDHKASLEPDELRSMVRSIRNVEKALGIPRKAPTPAELEMRLVARRSLVATCNIMKGEVFTEANIGVKRPGTGVSPLRYWECIGRVAKRDYKQDEMIEL